MFKLGIICTVDTEHSTHPGTIHLQTQGMNKESQNCSTKTSLQENQIRLTSAPILIYNILKCLTFHQLAKKHRCRVANDSLASVGNHANAINFHKHLTKVATTEDTTPTKHSHPPFLCAHIPRQHQAKRLFHSLRSSPH